MASSPPLDELRAEHEAVVIGPLLKELLEKLVRATAPTYPPLEYSDAQIWNGEAIEDALHGWVADRLLRRGDLAAMLLRSNSTEHLRAMLTTSFGQWLVNQRPRTSATNLFSRTKKLLKAKFEAVGPKTSRANEQFYTLKGGNEDPSGVSLRGLVAIAHELDDETLEVVRYGPNTLKSSPILRDPKLEEFVHHILLRAEGALTLGRIAEVERYRFNLPTFERIELEAALESETVSTIVSVERSDLARSVLARLGPDLESLVHAYSDTDSIPSAAKRAGLSAAEFSARLNHVLGMIADFADDPDEAAAVFEELLDLVR